MADTPSAGEIRSTPFADALSERYLSYALSTIMARSLPDVRDGLKPVHRRLLHAMRQLRLDPDQGFKKCARIVGDVMGKYHPHGDAAIYDALVRLAQEFAARYPLVDGQGNFGNIDGDNAAAMRYTEARMTAVAELLLDGIDEDAVDFRPTYDGEGEEPVVLPANFPNLLANGAQGIAVGMATSIPPHNVGELADALLHLIDHPEARIDTLVRFIPGPDLPTGGVLVEPRESIVATYASGRGSFRLRARWHAEKLKGGVYQVVVSEIPYQVQKARLIERIAELLLERKLALLADVRDESADDIRLVLEPKSRNVDPEVLMETLFRQTELEVRIPLNMNVLDGGLTPRVMSLREVLSAYLDHRQDVLVRRSRHRLGKIEERLEILEGFRIAYLNLDKVIRIIREEDDPKAVMMRRFKLSETQVEAVLNMRLRALRRLEEIAIREEHKALSVERGELKALLKDEGKRWKRIGEELRALKAKFGPKTALGKRRTEIGTAPAVEEVPLEAYVEREPVTVICSEKGWIRSVKGHLADASELKYKEGDRGKFVIPAETTDKLLVFATNGRFYTLGCDKLPGGRGFGEPLRLMIELGNDQEVVHMRVYKPEEKLIVAAEDGRGFVVKAEDAFAQTRTGKQVLNLEAGREAAACAPVVGDWLAVLGENRKLLLFRLAEVPEMARGRGVILQKYKDGGLSDVKSFSLEEGLSCRTGERTRSFTKAELKDWIGARAQAGRLPPAGFPRALKFE
ncbi:MAG TPA: DNA topoisomerase IV subunit A [Alphaproteobacteria bacterium]|nr:DNA topoisomerase IV subunit A [Alphaproteobacteria bacterium]